MKKFDIKTILTTLFIAFWAICDDAILTRWAGFATVIMATAAGLIILALLTRVRPALALPVWLMAGAMAISWVANPDLDPALVQFIYLGAGIGGMYAAAWLGGDVIRRALFWAGWLWLIGVAVAWIAGIHINRNIIGFWPVIFMIATLEAPYKIDKRARSTMLAVFLITIILAQSRGGLLANAVALLVYYPPKIEARRKIAVGVSFGGFALLLVAMNITKSVYRLYYWKLALSAMWELNPWFGVGPGGILARGIIPEPGQLWNAPHAHNILIHHFAELGIIGGLVLVAGLIWGFSKRGQADRWQLAALAGVLAHSMVDHPLFYFSPLLVVLMIAGSIQKHDQPDPAGRVSV